MISTPSDQSDSMARVRRKSSSSSPKPTLESRQLALRSARKICTSFICHDLHQVFKDLFAHFSIRLGTVGGGLPTRLYTNCFLCPFSAASDYNHEMARHLHVDHILPAMQRYKARSTTKLDTLLLYHYACVRKNTVPEVPGYDSVTYIKERNQFYFAYRHYSRAKDFVEPSRDYYAGIEAHVKELSFMDPAMVEFREARRARIKAMPMSSWFDADAMREDTQLASKDFQSIYMRALQEMRAHT